MFHLDRPRGLVLLAAASLAAAATLLAADAWQTKPFPQWTDKDVAKLVGSSPWAHEVRVTPGRVPSAAGLPARHGGTMGDASNHGPMSADSGMRGAPDAGDPASHLERGGSDPLTEMGQTITVVVRWQSALPLRQAEVRAKYGSEAATSDQVKQQLAQDPNVYVVAVFGLPVSQAGIEFTRREALAQTTLSAKGKDPLRPLRVDVTPGSVSATGGRLADLYFTFPKNTPFAIADKEVDFSTTVDSTAVRSTFRLKDMMFGGSLSL